MAKTKPQDGLQTAYFPGTGPAAATCGQCKALFFKSNDGRRPYDLRPPNTTPQAYCGKWSEFMSGRQPSVVTPPVTRACKYYKPAHPCFPPALEA